MTNSGRKERTTVNYAALSKEPPSDQDMWGEMKQNIVTWLLERRKKQKQERIRPIEAKAATMTIGPILLGVL